jgi:DNA-binding NtrC family response regulator
LPHEEFGNQSLIVAGGPAAQQNFSEREILYKVLFDMKNDLNDLKQLVSGMLQSGSEFAHDSTNADLIQRVFSPGNGATITSPAAGVIRLPQTQPSPSQPNHIEAEESLSLQNSEKELIEKALKKHRNKRKYAAEELGISERTLYRKIKEYNLVK